ncbi:O-linked N-acetylglucosamine transferase, SPINDLY family protein [Selenomonas sp. oral taxon 136]|uniref:O-linked N-acetylglucosamine transferase, SPINDLY family protein n=1 Tax=Selenomonas sp. oral taxon 136 TaxID=713030 RepID=UPI0007680967|nr:hypothetical protein [Selenomonas sp. oral taxon 136]AME03890.1 hypothetical protein AXE86_07310 [Selenomonas sp. oral taxon 136]
MEQERLFPAERQWELHDLIGQALYWLADLPAALPHLRLAWELPREHHADRLAALSNYLMYLHYADGVTDEMMRDAHAAYAKMLGSLPLFSHTVRKHGKLRIGYLSPNLTDHIVLNFAIQLFSAYNRSRYEVRLYDIGTLQCETTDWVAGMVDGYTDLSKCRPQEAAARIHADEIDILFDLAGHSAGGKTLMIAAYKPAPIQLSGIGYFNTTGLSAMDYFLGDPFCDPPGEEANFTEQILRLPQTHLCFTPSERFRPYEHLQRTPHENVVFASFNNFAKITDAMLTAWGEILRAVPTARLLLKNVHPLKETLTRMKKRAVRAGIDPARLELRPGSKDYLADYLDADVILDTFPYQGGGTTCEALCMGLPIVVRAGARHGARFGVSLLHNAGLSELIAGSTEEYIERAILLARDRELLRALQTAVPHMMRASPLMNGMGYVRAMEAAYQMIWERYLHEKT